MALILPLILSTCIETMNVLTAASKIGIQLSEFLKRMFEWRIGTQWHRRSLLAALESLHDAGFGCVCTLLIRDNIFLISSIGSFRISAIKIPLEGRNQQFRFLGSFFMHFQEVAFLYKRINTCCSINN